MKSLPADGLAPSAVKSSIQFFFLEETPICTHQTAPQIYVSETNPCVLLSQQYAPDVRSHIRLESGCWSLDLWQCYSSISHNGCQHCYQGLADIINLHYVIGGLPKSLHYIIGGSSQKWKSFTKGSAMLEVMSGVLISTTDEIYCKNPQ